MANKRKILIENIINDLLQIRKTGIENKYALEENIKFFKAARSPLLFIFWLIFRAPTINGTLLLELCDISFQKWDHQMHEHLIEIQRKPFPGLIRPLVNAINNFIHKSTTKNLTLVNFGSGGLEIERQLISHILISHSAKNVTFICIDNSQTAHEIGKNNLYPLRESIQIIEIEKLNKDGLVSILDNREKPCQIILCRNDIFSILNEFQDMKFDLVYNSFFMHHLNLEKERRLLTLIESLTKHYFEYDGYKSWLIMIPQILTIWKHPVLLNATIFSDLRYKTKNELVVRKKGSITFSRTGTYLSKLQIS